MDAFPGRNAVRRFSTVDDKESVGFFVNQHLLELG